MPTPTTDAKSAKKLQAAPTPTDAGVKVYLPSRGVDIGTAYLAAGVMHDDSVTMDLESIRDCFITLPSDEAANLEAGGVNFRVSEDGESLIVIGQEAIDLAAIHGTELRRPLARGFISDKEDLSKEVVNIILQQLLGAPCTRGELAVYSVPGPALGDDASKAQYHTRFFGDRLKELGFTPMPINEAMAVVYAAWKSVANNGAPLSGLGISFGAGMINVAMVHKGMLVRAFSLPFGGDFIDEAAAKATNSQMAQVTLLKEEGLDLTKGSIFGEPKAYHDAQSLRQAEALCLMYRELLTKLRDAITAFFSRPENRVGDVKHVLPVIISGGTSRPHGFETLFEEIVLKGVELRFPLADHVTGVSDPMGAVAAGALTFARMRSAKNE